MALMRCFYSSRYWRAISGKKEPHKGSKTLFRGWDESRQQETDTHRCRSISFLTVDKKEIPRFPREWFTLSEMKKSNRPDIEKWYTKKVLKMTKVIPNMFVHIFPQINNAELPWRPRGGKFLTRDLFPLPSSGKSERGNSLREKAKIRRWGSRHNCSFVDLFPKNREDTRVMLIR